MARTPAPSPQPRKTPRQARSRVTLDAVLEATLQVLRAEGAQRLTTTRVAERAGVSVGTLYQYHANKQSLVHALLERHLLRQARAVEEACTAQQAQPAARMAAAVARAYVQAKTDNLPESRALYALTPALQLAGLYDTVARRMHRAIVAMLQTARDRQFDDAKLVAFTMLSAIAGTTRALLESSAASRRLAGVGAELEVLCAAYVQRAGRLRRRG